MKKIVLFICFVFSLSSFGQNIEGNWKFDYILPETQEIGENLKPVTENDEMNINEDGHLNMKLAD